MALRGNLRDFSLPDVFQLVTLSGKTGVLRIKRTGAEGTIWFRDGEIFFAQSDWHREPLGTRLVSAGRLTPSGLSKALDVQKAEPEGGRRLGQILVDEGYIPENVLEAFVQEQIQDTIFDLFRWDEGDFDFEQLDSVPEEDIGLSVSIENVVMEGSRRLEEWNRIKKKIPSMDIVFKMATAPGEGTFDISLKPTEWNLLLKVDGTRSVSELARDFDRTDFEVARVIYGLFSAGLLEVASDEEVEKLRAERLELESKSAKVDRAKAEKDEAATMAALEREAHAVADAQSRAQGSATVEPSTPVAPPAEAVAPAADHVVEEPAFLGAGGTATAADMAVFEEMMGAVLHAPAEAPAAEEAPPAVEAEPLEVAVEEPSVPPVEEAAPAGAAVEEVAGTPYVTETIEGTPYVTEVVEPYEGAPATEAVPEATEAELVELLGAAQAPEIEPAPEVEELTAAPAVTGDYAADLMALGLGELPSEDLLAPVGTEQAPPVEMPPVEEIPADFTVAEIEAMSEPPAIVFEPEAPAEVPAEPAIVDRIAEPVSVGGTAEQRPEEDLNELLSSLEADSGESVVLDTSAVGLDFGGPSVEAPVAEEAAASGVISTDAFLSDFSGGDVSFGSVMTDELTALTGGGRQRPQASAKKISTDGENAPATINRDQHVDRALVEKIIEGVKKL